MNIMSALDMVSKELDTLKKSQTVLSVVLAPSTLLGASLCCWGYRVMIQLLA